MTITARVSGIPASGQTSRVPVSGGSAAVPASLGSNPWGGTWGNTWGRSWLLVNEAIAAVEASPAIEATSRVSERPTYVWVDT